LHFWYFPGWLGPATSTEDVESMGPFLLFGAIFQVLHFEWFTLLIVWRTARAVALLDDIETVENMPRFISSVYCFRDVWRSWHASMNIWIIRYIYKPLGGRRRRCLSVLLSFLFIAFWHDIRGFGDAPNWYWWAFLNSAGVASESLLLKLLGPIAGRVVIRFLVIGANIPALLANNGFTAMRLVLVAPGLMCVLGVAFGLGAMLEDGTPPAQEPATK